MKLILKNILTITISFLLAFIFIEGILRIWQPLELRVRGNKLTLPKNTKYTYLNNKIPNLDREITISKNSIGFRGEDPPKIFSEYLTIIAIGGSTTECVFLSDGKTWVDKLTQRLKKDFHHLWVNNAGLDGASSYGHIVLMEDFIVPLKPKIALFLVGINDVENDALSGGDRNILRSPGISTKSDLIRTFMDKSEFFNYLMTFYKYIKARQKEIDHKYINFKELNTVVMTADDSQKILQLQEDKYLLGYRQRIGKLVALCRNNSIEPVLITQPAFYGCGIDALTGKNLENIKFANKNGKVAWMVLELYNGVLRDAAQNNNLLLIDLAHKLPKGSKYFYDYHHFNNEGADIVAEIIYYQLAPFLKINYPSYNRH